MTLEERGTGLLYRCGVPESENVTYGISFYPDGVEPATARELAEFNAEPVKVYENVVLNKVVRIHELIAGYRGPESELLKHIENILRS